MLFTRYSCVCKGFWVLYPQLDGNMEMRIVYNCVCACAFPCVCVRVCLFECICMYLYVCDVCIHTCYTHYIILSP